MPTYFVRAETWGKRSAETWVKRSAETWSKRSAERRKVNVLELKCLRNLVGVSEMDRVGNEEVRKRAGIEKELAS